MYSIVLMESGADWSSRVEHEAGALSQIVVIAKKPSESNDEFETRVRLRLETVGDALRSHLRKEPAKVKGIFVSSEAPRLTLAGRMIAGRALCETVRRSGGGEVVMVGDDHPRLVSELETFATRLNRRVRDGAGRVALRFQPEPSAPAIHRVA